MNKNLALVAFACSIFAQSKAGMGFEDWREMFGWWMESASSYEKEVEERLQDYEYRLINAQKTPLPPKIAPPQKSQLFNKTKALS